MRRDQTKVAGLEPSINLIRPYTNVALEGVSDDAAYDFSACCIRNARDVLLVLEQDRSFAVCVVVSGIGKGIKILFVFFADISKELFPCRTIIDSFINTLSKGFYPIKCLLRCIWVYFSLQEVIYISSIIVTIRFIVFL